MSAQNSFGNRPTGSTRVIGEDLGLDAAPVISKRWSSVSAEQQEHPFARYNSDTVVPPQNIHGQDGSRSRPPSRRGAHLTHGIKTTDPWDIQVPDAPLNCSWSSRSHWPPRFRDDYDSDYYWDPRDYPPERDYDRQRRGVYRPGRHARRTSRPPPTIHNYKRYGLTNSDSDEERCFEDVPADNGPFQGPRTRVADEEAALQVDEAHGHASPVRRGNIDTEQLDLDGLTPREKVKVLRLPLIQWMRTDAKGHFVAFIGELIGTCFFLVFAFAGTEVANNQSKGGNEENTTTGNVTGSNIESLLYISLSFGFSLMVNAWVFFRISGALFNPALLVAMLFVRALTFARAICLFVAQMSGALLASAIVRYLFPESFNVRTTLGGGASITQGLLIEVLLTAQLVFTILMLAKEKHRATYLAPVGIGMALFISELIGVQYTGGSLNPARSFAPCVITGIFDREHWIYCKFSSHCHPIVLQRQEGNPKGIASLIDLTSPHLLISSTSNHSRISSKYEANIPIRGRTLHGGSSSCSLLQIYQDTRI